MFREVNQNAEALKKNFLELTELKHILRKTQQFFDEQESLEQGGQIGQHTQLIQVRNNLFSFGPVHFFIFSMFLIVYCMFEKDD